MNGRIAETDIDLAGIVEIVELEAHVQCRLNGRLRDFRLLISEDGLVLQGRASTFYAKQLALHAVMRTTGLPILANEIEVCLSARGPNTSKCTND